ncbi:uncharacterized protein [Aegilops tauschii subsp. strangulata]|uniref:uncharacterized protein n=1 Tax=Aegilops tauschii subsp. strangulata TaxID=200361 RepID=UPI00098A21D4|nr:uncharacterized protein LOC109753705 [Aegilops tauschii subsp. strangulata]
MHFDSSKMPTGLGAGIVLSSSNGNRLRYALQIHFVASNNVAEYEVLVHGLRLAKEIGIRRILCCGDSDLVVQQASSKWDARDANMASYRFLVQRLSGGFDGCEFLHVPRADNEVVDMLAKIASLRQAIPSEVCLERLQKASIKPSLDSDSIFVLADQGVPLPSAGLTALVPALELLTSARPWGLPALPPKLSWAHPVLTFLESGELPANEVEAQLVQCRASSYTIINNELVKRSTTGVFQRCVEPDKGLEILLDIHQGECGHHAASRALVAKAFRHGSFWPMALEDAEQLVLKCEGCQRFSKSSHQPATTLQTIPITWPFAVWGLDMVGPFKTAQGGMTHLLVAVDKFTKCIEARQIKKLKGPTTVRFIKDIAVCYGVPHNIITDNGTNFAKGALAQYCSASGIRLNLAPIAHPQSNNQVERANGLILAGIKPRLVEPLVRSPGSWLDELSADL